MTIAGERFFSIDVNDIRHLLINLTDNHRSLNTGAVCVSWHLTNSDSLNNDKSLSLVVSFLLLYSMCAHDKKRRSSGQPSETPFEETYAAGCASEPIRRAIFHFTHTHPYFDLHRAQEERKEEELQSRPMDSWCDRSERRNQSKHFV